MPPFSLPGPSSLTIWSWYTPAGRGSDVTHSFGLPSLASSSDNLFRLCVSTLLYRDDFGGQDLQSQRSDQGTGLGTYRRQQLGSTRVCCGDSLVREYSTICSCFSVIEQWISLCITKTDRGWAGKRQCQYLPREKIIADMHSVIAWMDQGRPLGRISSGAMDESHGIQPCYTTTNPPTSSQDGISNNRQSSRCSCKAHPSFPCSTIH